MRWNMQCCLCWTYETDDWVLMQAHALAQHDVSQPESIRSQLALDAIDARDVTRADGTTIRVPYVGPLEVRFSNRVGCTGALVMGDQVVLGAMALADMDLVIHPTTWTVEVNPESPDLGTSWARCTLYRVRAGTVPSGDHGRTERDG